MLSPTLRRLLLVVPFLVLIPLTGLTAMDLRNRQLAARSPIASEPFNLPPARLLRALAFGYNELVADLVWLKSINYFADQLFQKKEMVYIEHYLTTASFLDPHFEALYRYGPAMMLSQKGSQHTNEEVMAAIRLLKRANTLFPENWRYAKSLGSFYLFELTSQDPKQRAAWKRIGADWIRRAALLGGDHSFLATLAASVYSEQGQQELAIQHLQEIYLTTQDETMKQTILNRLNLLQAQHLGDELRHAEEAFNRAFQNSQLSYIPEDLFILLRPEPDAPFSLAEAVTRGVLSDEKN